MVNFEKKSVRLKQSFTLGLRESFNVQMIERARRGQRQTQVGTYLESNNWR